MTMLNTPTDPLEVLCEQAVARIRRYVEIAHARIGQWEPRPYDMAPVHGYHRPTKPLGVGR